MTDVLKLIVADDHPIVIQGLQMLFEDHPGVEIVSSASNYYEILNSCNVYFPNVLVLDINLGGDNSLNHMNELLNLYPEMKIVIFSSYDNPGMVRKALKKGAHAYLLKDATPEEWNLALESIVCGDVFLSRSLQRKDKVPARELITADSFAQISSLSKQELRIIKAISEGLNEREIANRFFISKNTVHTHKKNLMKKIDAHSNAEIVKFAYENHLVANGS